MSEKYILVSLRRCTNTVWQGSAEQVILPTVDKGTMGVLPNHVETIVDLEVGGTMSMKVGTRWINLVVQGGFACVMSTPSRLVIFTEDVCYENEDEAPPSQ